MPKYNYECSRCEIVFEIVHPMSEKLIDCLSCEMSGSLKRLPSSFITKYINTDGKQKPGALVEKNISEFRETLKNQKKEITGKEYKS